MALSAGDRAALARALANHDSAKSIADALDGVIDGTVEADTVAEQTAGSGVTVDGVLLKDGTVQGTEKVGTAGTNCTVTHYGDGRNMRAVVTLTNVAVTVGQSANLGTGALVYTLPDGAILIHGAYMSVGLSGVTITNDTPDIGLGTVIASGEITTLDGTATFENILTGQTMDDTNGTAEVKAAGPTAGAPLEITTAGAHTVHVNLADGWGNNTDASGLLNGTVVIDYTWMAA